jgi:hypothetical protein
MGTMTLSTVQFKPRSTIGDEYQEIGTDAFNKAKNMVYAAFAKAFPAYKYTKDETVNRFRQDIGYDSGLDCIAKCTECLGDNRDTVYSVCTIPQRFTVSDVAIVFGVNHNVTGKSLFTQIGVYDTLKQFGLDSVDIYNKDNLFYAVFVTKVPLNLSKMVLPSFIKPVIYQVPVDVQVITITERAYLQVQGGATGVSADPKTIILPTVQLRSAVSEAVSQEITNELMKLQETMIQ